MRGEFATESIEFLAVIRDARGSVQVSGSLYPPGAALQVRLPGIPVEAYALAVSPWNHPRISTAYLRRILQWMFGPFAGGQEVSRYPL
ncbi:MAG: hypothetical protein L3J76_06070, partial [Candidatus Hydrothermae bacterium]|nr:hypothetical protein [Candidatus Hydrothermae bacterium]